MLIGKWKISNNERLFWVKQMAYGTAITLLFYIKTQINREDQYLSYIHT